MIAPIAGAELDVTGRDMPTAYAPGLRMALMPVGTPTPQIYTRAERRAARAKRKAQRNARKRGRK